MCRALPGCTVAAIKGAWNMRDDGDNNDPFAVYDFTARFLQIGLMFLCMAWFIRALHAALS